MQSLATVQSLQRRISEMQPLRADDRAFPAPASLARLLPGGALRRGAAYSVHGSRRLALALMSEASANGVWCGAIGCSDLGVEATASLGISLERCVLVPRPGRNEIGIVGALGETLGVVVVQQRVQPSHAESERVLAKFRECGSVLIVLGDWPRGESTLRVVSSQWRGLGSEHGRITSHDLVVESSDRRGVLRHAIRFDAAGIHSDEAPSNERLPPRLVAV